MPIIHLWATEVEWGDTDNPETLHYFHTREAAEEEYMRDYHGRATEANERDDVWDATLYELDVALPDEITPETLAILMNGGYSLRTRIHALKSERCESCGELRIPEDEDEPNAFSEEPQATDTMCADCVAEEQQRIADEARERIHVEEPRLPVKTRNGEVGR